MMKLSKKVDYGLILLSNLERQPEHESAREMAGRFRLPLPMVANVLKTLTSAGILFSTRGAQGGYRLTKPSSQISLADVVRALDGPLALMDCTAAPDGCKLISHCPTHSPVQALQQKFQDFLEAVSLEEIANPPMFELQQAASAHENTNLS